MNMEFKKYFSINDLFVEKTKRLVASSNIDELLISGDVFPVDNLDCYMHFLTGVGGKESESFAKEIMIFYKKIISNSGFRISFSSEIDSSINQFSFKVSGKNAYKFLKYENGIYRVQRVPATEKNGRLHTSTIAIMVMPNVPNVFTFNEKDIRIDRFRAQGKGGQHVNKTESAVRITHIPTGIQAVCQDGRSQLDNKAKALENLKRKVELQHNINVENELQQFVKENSSKKDRNEKVRTFDYKLNKISDHRTGKSYNLDQVLSKSKSIDCPILRDTFLFLENKKISTLVGE